MQRAHCGLKQPSVEHSTNVVNRHRLGKLHLTHTRPSDTPLTNHYITLHHTSYHENVSMPLNHLEKRPTSLPQHFKLLHPAHYLQVAISSSSRREHYKPLHSTAQRHMCLVFPMLPPHYPNQLTGLPQSFPHSESFCLLWHKSPFSGDPILPNTGMRERKNERKKERKKVGERK